MAVLDFKQQRCETALGFARTVDCLKKTKMTHVHVLALLLHILQLQPNHFANHSDVFNSF